MISLITAWFGKYLAWIEIGAAVVVAAALGWQHMHVLGLKAEIETNKAAYAVQVADAASAAEAQSETYRAEEQRRTAAIQEKVDEAQTRNVQLAADAAFAAVAARSLQQRVATLVAQARSAPSNPGPAAGSASAPDAIGMLAELQRRADERAGILALIADARGSAGILCQQSYDALGR